MVPLMLRKGRKSEVSQGLQQMLCLTEFGALLSEGSGPWNVLETGAPLVPLTLHSMNLPASTENSSWLLTGHIRCI